MALRIPLSTYSRVAVVTLILSLTIIQIHIANSSWRDEPTHTTIFIDDVWYKCIGCRDDTIPETVDTRRHRKVGLRACNNLPQSRCRDGVVEDCCMLSALLHGAFLILAWCREDGENCGLADFCVRV